MIWTQGEIVADDALSVGVADRSFEHGLGLFETLRTWNGASTLLPRHLERMRRSALSLGLPIEGVRLPTADDVAALLEADGRVGDAVVRLTMSGGVSDAEGAIVWMRSTPLPPSPSMQGARLGTAGPARQDPLAAHKTLNYWPYRLLSEQARAEGCDEALLIDAKGCVLEGSRTNIFFVVRGGLVTAPADGRILPGIMRGVVVERARSLGIEVEETAMSLLDRRFQPEEIFLTNAVRGVVPVGRWGMAEFPVPGAVARTVWNDVRCWLEGEAV